MGHPSLGSFKKYKHQNIFIKIQFVQMVPISYGIFVFRNRLYYVQLFRSEKYHVYTMETREDETSVPLKPPQRSKSTNFTNFTTRKRGQCLIYCWT